MNHMILNMNAIAENNSDQECEIWDEYWFINDFPVTMKNHFKISPNTKQNIIISISLDDTTITNIANIKTIRGKLYLRRTVNPNDGFTLSVSNNKLSSQVEKAISDSDNLEDDFIESETNPLNSFIRDLDTSKLNSTTKEDLSIKSSNAISILEDGTIKRLISTCPALTNITKNTIDYYESPSIYNDAFPNQDNKIHTWTINIQTGVIAIGDEKKMTVLTVKPKGTASEMASVLRWEINLLESLPTIIESAKNNGVRLRVEKRVNGGDYSSFADANGVIDLLDDSKYTAVLRTEHENLSSLELINSFSALDDVDTNGNGRIDPEEIFDISTPKPSSNNNSKSKYLSNSDLTDLAKFYFSLYVGNQNSISMIDISTTGGDQCVALVVYNGGNVAGILIDRKTGDFLGIQK